MGLTHLPHGLHATPLIGAQTERYYSWWGNKTYYVDFDYGSDANNGQDPQRAFKNPATAFSTMSAKDTLYVRPRDVVSTDTDPSYYTPASATNWTIPKAKFGMAIIGAGPQIGSGQIHQTYIRGHADVTASTLGSSTLTVRAPYTSVENLAIHRGGNTRSLLEFYGDGTSTDNAWGSSANNCLFRFMNTSSFGALHILDSWYCGVYNSHFYRNQIGVMARGLQSTVREIQVVGNIFSGDTADVDAHVVVLGGASRWGHIYGNYFNSGIPAKSAGSYGVYIHTPAMESGSSSLISNNYFATNDASSDITEGSGVIRAGNWDGSGEVEHA